MIVFLQQKTNTRVMKVYEPIHEFPSVTICNINPFNTYTTNTTDYLMAILTEANFTFPMNATLASTTAIQLTLKAMAALKTGLNDRYYKGEISKTDLKGLGFSIDDLLVSCSYMGMECYGSDFKYSYSYDYGNCYTFNPNNYVRYTSSGPGTGLELELFSGIPGELN